MTDEVGDGSGGGGESRENHNRVKIDDVKNQIKKKKKTQSA